MASLEEDLKAASDGLVRSLARLLEIIDERDAMKALVKELEAKLEKERAERFSLVDALKPVMETPWDRPPALGDVELLREQYEKFTNEPLDMAEVGPVPTSEAKCRTGECEDAGGRYLLCRECHGRPERWGSKRSTSEAVIEGAIREGLGERTPPTTYDHDLKDCEPDECDMLEHIGERAEDLLRRSNANATAHHAHQPIPHPEAWGGEERVTLPEEVQQELDYLREYHDEEQERRHRQFEVGREVGRQEAMPAEMLEKVRRFCLTVRRMTLTYGLTRVMLEDAVAEELRDILDALDAPQPRQCHACHASIPPGTGGTLYACDGCAGVTDEELMRQCGELLGTEKGSRLPVVMVWGSESFGAGRVREVPAFAGSGPTIRAALLALRAKLEGE